MGDRVASFQRSSLVRSGALVLVGLSLVAALACRPGGSPFEELLADGRAKFEEGLFHDAKAAFATVLDQDPDHAAAAYGYARTAMVLNEYEEAIPAFERALALALNDPRVHEGYVHSLYWGGTLKGRRDWLDRAIEAGGDGIRRFPDLGPIYFLGERAAAGLNEPDMWLRILAEAEPDAGHSPVFRIHQAGARLEQAKSGADDDRKDAVGEEIRAQLDEAAKAAEVGASEQETGLLRYVLVHGYKLLGDKDAQRHWLQSLEEIAAARHLAADYVHFDYFFEAYYAASEEPVDVRLEILDRWVERFPMRWENEDFSTASVPLTMRLGLLVDESERRARPESLQATDSPPDRISEDSGGGEAHDPVEMTTRLASLTEEALLDEVIDLGERLALLDASFGLSHYGQVISHLLNIDERPDEALRLADLGLARIKEGRSGLFYPGTPEEELEAVKADWWAGFELARGQALERVGRTAEAEESLRSAVARWKRADRLAALAEFLLEQGRDTEGYQTLVSALAWHAEEGWLGDEPSRREEALAAAERLGGSESTLEQDLAAAGERVRVEHRERVLGRPLDREAPGFELADTQGNEWQLSDLVGKTVVLNYWATWCGPCRAELPHYDALVDTYAERDDVVFLAITTDADHSVAREFLLEHGYDFTTLFDEGSATDFNITGIPATIVIGPEGRIQYRAGGFPGQERYAREMGWRLDELTQG